MNVNITKEQYRKHTEEAAPKSPLALNMAKAFAVGGLICVVGQVIMEILKARGLDKEAVGSFTSIILIFCGAFATGLNIYDNLGKFAGAGSIVPITGFANSIVSPAMEFKSEGYVVGVGARMFQIAGPVLVYGITASVIAGIIYFFIR